GPDAPDRGPGAPSRPRRPRRRDRLAPAGPRGLLCAEPEDLYDHGLFGGRDPPHRPRSGGRADRPPRRPAEGSGLHQGHGGRAELLAYLETEMARVRARMPEVFATVPRGGFEIRRIPVEIEGGAPGGYASAGSLDGTRPGIYYINLKDTADWPRWSLKTLTYH